MIALFWRGPRFLLSLAGISNPGGSDSGLMEYSPEIYDTQPVRPVAPIRASLDDVISKTENAVMT